MNIGELIAASYLKSFAGKSPETVLSRSLQLLDQDSIKQTRTYLYGCFSESGGFCDRAGKADLYYTLFGYFLAKALNLDNLVPAIRKFAEHKIQTSGLSDVELHCAAIITASTPRNIQALNGFRSLVKQSIQKQLKQHKTYNAFLSLLTCYYIKDFKGIYLIRKHLHRNEQPDMPCPVWAANLVLQKSFNRHADDLAKNVYSFYDNRGGFKATKSVKEADLLSTAVALYSLNFAGEDLRMIRPDCLTYIDSLYRDGGFFSNSYDPEPDVEYTFYGLLALGALAT